MGLEELEINKDTISSEAYFTVLANLIEGYNVELKKDDIDIELKNKVLSSLNEAFSLYKTLKQSVLEQDISQVTDIISEIETKLSNGDFVGYTPVKGVDYVDGQDGLSAYEVAVQDGYEGTEAEWLESLKGQDGYTPEKGVDYVDGQDGLSAYEVAVQDGYEGTEAEWLESLKGQDGYTPVKGVDYVDGQDGLSAYEVAVQNGFSGTESEWLEHLRGEDTGWISIVDYLAGDWLVYNETYPLQYRKIGKIVFLRGIVKSGADYLVLENLPLEIRPNRLLYLPVAFSYPLSSTSHSAMILSSSGTLKVYSYGSSWTSINCSYCVE